LEKQQAAEKQVQQSKVFKAFEPTQDVQNSNEAKKRAQNDDGESKWEQADNKVHQTVSATCIQEYTNNMYIQMSNALTGNAFRSTNLATHQKKPQPRKVNKNSLFSLPLHLI
jgi:hypothetical protein